MIESIKRELAELPFYKQYNQMIPHVGEKFYSGEFKKLLIVAESHYLPENSNIHLNEVKWYNSSKSDLTEKEIDWTFTSNIFMNANHKIYHNIRKVLTEAGLDKDAKHEYVGYMNYFLRPAKERKSISDSVSKLDREMSFDNFKNVIDIVKPDLIIFVSKYSVLAFEEYKINGNPVWNYTDSLGIKYTYTNHPTTSWWNRATRKNYFNGRTSREHFVHFLNENHFVTQRG